MRSFILSAAISALLSSTAVAGVFDLQFRRMDVRANTDACRNLLRSVALDFANSSGASVIDSGCVESEFGGGLLDGVITYEADERVETTSTYTYPVYSTAFYASLEACEAEIENQISTFESATGLQALIAYCMYEGSFSREWSTRIDAVGVTEMKPDQAALSAGGTIHEPERLRADLLSAAEEQGIVIAEIGMSGNDVFRNLVIRAYAPFNIDLADYDEMMFASLEQCVGQLQKVRGLMTNADVQAIVFCESNRSFRGNRMHVAVFKDLMEYNPYFRARSLANSFGTLDACEAAAESIETSPSIFGGACAGTSGDYRVHLFTRP